MRALTTRAPRNYAFLIWKRPSKGGNGKLYTGIPIPGMPTPGTDIYSGFTPFTLIKNANNRSMLFAGTHNEFEPLQFYEIQPFRIVTDKAEADLRKVYLNVHTFNGVDYNAGEVSSLVNDKRGSGVAWWPFVVGPIVLILLVAVIYYAVNKNKTVDPVYEKSTVEGYKSIGDAGQIQPKINLTTADPNAVHLSADDQA